MSGVFIKILVVATTKLYLKVREDIHNSNTVNSVMILP